MRFFNRERFGRVMKLSLPAALGSFVDMLQVLIDLIMVGRLEVAATAAVGIGLQFAALFYTLIGILFIGSNALMSRSLGAKDYDRASLAFGSFLSLGAFLAIPSVLIASYFAYLPFVLMGAEGRVAALGTEYLFVLSFSLPAMIFNQIVFSAFSANADVKTPFKIKFLMAFVNVAISYLLIFGTSYTPAFGVGGAAAGTVIVTYIESIIYVVMMELSARPFSFGFSWSLDLIKRGLNIGIPAGVERLINYSSFLIFTRIIADFGTAIMAGYQIGLRVEGLAFMPGVGFTIAAMALVGRNIGANDPDEAEKDALFTAMSAGGLMAVAGIAMIVFAQPIVSIFSTDSMVIEEGVRYLQIVGLSQFPLGIAFVLSGAFRGAGDSRTSLKINVLSIWSFRIVPAFIASIYFENILIIWIILLTETYIRAAWLFWTFKKGKWKTINV